MNLNQTTILVKTLAFPRPVLIPKGWVVWVYAEGGGDAHPYPVEVQYTLYVKHGTRVELIS